MGLLSLLHDAFKGVFKAKRPKIDATCPKCKAKISTDMERCPGCGTHVSSMFRIECPNCHEANELNAAACKKCGKAFVPPEEEAAPRQPIYVCPLCGYRANYYMLSCPACGVKFS